MVRRAALLKYQPCLLHGALSNTGAAHDASMTGEDRSDVAAVVAIPGHERAQAVFDRRARRKSRGALQLRTVGEGFEHVDRTHWQQFTPGRLADDFFQKIEQGRDLDRLFVADIVEAVTRLRRRPWRRRGLARAHPRLAGVP